MIVQAVDVRQVHQVWSMVEPMLEAAYDAAVGNPDCTLEQLKAQLANGVQVMLVATDGADITGVATIALVNYPNHRCATITAAGGRGITDGTIVEQVIAWCKQQGATKLKVQASGSRARLYEQKLALVPVAIVMERLI